MDGENLERLWSYLEKFSKITKEMSPENRTDIMAQGLYHYTKKVEAKFNVSLVQKHEKAQQIAESSHNPLPDFQMYLVTWWNNIYWMRKPPVPILIHSLISISLPRKNILFIRKSWKSY